MAGFSIVLLSFAFLVTLFTMIAAISLLAYVLQSLGLYRMMRKTGLEKTWTAWVPFAHPYALGALADNYQARTVGKSTAYRKKLMIWFVVLAVLCVGFLIAFLCWMPSGAGTLETTEGAAVRSEISRAMIFFHIASTPLYVAEFIFMVYYFIAYFQVCKLFSPQNAVLLLVLSILVSAAQPFVLLLLSKNTPAGQNTEDTPPPPPAPSPIPGRNIYSK
jgi:hypothetical protein